MEEGVSTPGVLPDPKGYVSAPGDAAKVCRRSMAATAEICAPRDRSAASESSPAMRNAAATTTVAWPSLGINVDRRGVGEAVRVRSALVSDS